MFGDLSKFEIAQSLNIKLNEINSYISMGNIPSIKVYLVNNGIIIVCSNAEYAPSSQSTNTIIKLTDAQIINGGQTSKTIQNVICDNKNKNEDFSQTYVLARIYKINDLNNINKNLIDKITLSTNSQNAIKSSDLRANDTIQQNIEIGLAKYDIKYIRRRDNKRAKKGDIRKEIVAEVILSAILKRPNEAKYKKALHFGMLYKEIFNERIINIEMIISLVKQFTYIETKRKTASNELLSNYPFIPYATYHILMEFYQIASDDSFEADYTKVLSIIKEKFKLLGIDMSKSLDIISVLKSNRLNG